MTDPFMIRAHVPEFEETQREYGVRSAAIRERHKVRTLFYGHGPREQIDLLYPETVCQRAPLHMFVHGGYWRAGLKEDYHFVAAPVLAAGGIAAFVEYDLIPTVRMGTLVAQVRRAFSMLATEADRLGADRARMTASGHSAGAHLASFLASRGAHEDFHCRIA